MTSDCQSWENIITCCGSTRICSRPTVLPKKACPAWTGGCGVLGIPWSQCSVERGKCSCSQGCPFPCRQRGCGERWLLQPAPKPRGQRGARNPSPTTTSPSPPHTGARRPSPCPAGSLCDSHRPQPSVCSVTDRCPSSPPVPVRAGGRRRAGLGGRDQAEADGPGSHPPGAGPDDGSAAGAEGLCSLFAP